MKSWPHFLHCPFLLRRKISEELGNNRGSLFRDRVLFIGVKSPGQWETTIVRAGAPFMHHFIQFHCVEEETEALVRGDLTA